MTAPYNPLSKVNLGKSVAEALLDREVYPLGELPVFDGAGIYAIYYDGDHPAYARLAEANADDWNVPLYIGKAIPSGGRRGTEVFSEIRGRHLYNRLREHGDSVRAAENLDVGDFFARWLVVDDIWIPLGETLLITRFQPVWNVALAGFGNHDPGGGRRAGLVPLWDVMHPGRSWALRQAPRTETPDDLSEMVREYLERADLGGDGKINFAPPGP